MSFLKTNMIAGALSVGIMSGLALIALNLGKFALHSHAVILNFYTNGTSDWAMDATTLLKSAFVLMLAIFCVGLALGFLVARKD